MAIPTNQLTSINPATGEEIRSYPIMSNVQVEEDIQKAQKRFLEHKKTSTADRKMKMLRVAEILEEQLEEWALTITEEMGKTVNEARGEVLKCAWVCQYYAENAAPFLANELIETDASKSYISYQPLGVLLGVMPWNYPFWQVFRFAAPALMAGNVVLLKHASNVPQCALNIERIFSEAGFPDHTFKTLLIKSSQVEAILKHKAVKAVSLTGSYAAGSAVASIAASQIKKAVLELGGSDANVILHDADIAHAAAQCAQSRLMNAGQSCIGAKRMIVVESVYDEFMDAFLKNMSSATFGNPHEEVTIGPLARHDLRDEVHQQVLDSVATGAKLSLGGTVPADSGAFYPPTILTHVKPGMPAYDEEIFGPVASVIVARDETDAIRIANDTSFGLGSCVFTKDTERGERIAREELEAGSCFVNQFVKSDPRLPFGGVKTSGFGRELSYYGIREFTNIKTVYVK